MDYMSQALSLARLAQGQVSPNPAVGAVIVKNGVVVGQGYTQPPGSDHAEIVALKQAGEEARGAVLYVTLEPCCHHGRTPPCTKALIKAGIKEVHYALIDPNPRVAGKGRDELEAAGIRTYAGEGSAEAAEMNEAFIKYITTGLPFVTVKFACSLDGKIATRTGDSKWITGEEARKYVQHIRYISDAVMTGANTVINDDPRLTVRLAVKGGITHKQPLRIVVDGLDDGQRLIVAKIAYEFKQPQRGDVIIIHPPVAPQKQWVKRIIGIPGDVIEVKNNLVYVNDVPLVEPYIKSPPNYNFSKLTVPPDNYFVMGDNRNNSSDSHTGWTVTRDNIVGEVWLRIWPFSQWGIIHSYPLSDELGGLNQK